MATLNTTPPETQVRELLEAWTRAVRARDLDGVLAHHSPDVVMFDVPPPDQWRGIQKYRESWELFFRHFPTVGGVFEITEMDIAASGDLAYGHGLLRCGGSGEDGPKGRGSRKPLTPTLSPKGRGGRGFWPSPAWF